MNPSVFREYDIRGLAEKDFDKDFALLLGKVHGTAVAETGRHAGDRRPRLPDHFRSLRRSGHCRHGSRRTSRLRHRHLSQPVALFFFVPSRRRRRDSNHGQPQSVRIQRL